MGIAAISGSCVLAFWFLHRLITDLLLLVLASPHQFYCWLDPEVLSQYTVLSVIILFPVSGTVVVAASVTVFITVGVTVTVAVCRRRHSRRHRRRLRRRHRCRYRRRYSYPFHRDCYRQLRSLYITLVIVVLVLVIQDNSFQSLRWIHFTGNTRCPPVKLVHVLSLHYVSFLVYQKTRVVVISMGRSFPRIVGAHWYLFRSYSEPSKTKQLGLHMWEMVRIEEFLMDWLFKITSHVKELWRSYVSQENSYSLIRILLLVCYGEVCNYERYLNLTLVANVKYPQSPLPIFRSLGCCWEPLVVSKSLVFQLCENKSSGALVINLISPQFGYLGVYCWRFITAIRNSTFLQQLGLFTCTTLLLPSSYMFFISKLVCILGSITGNLYLHAFPLVTFLCIIDGVLFQLLFQIMEFRGLTWISINHMKFWQDEEDGWFHYYGVIPFCLKGYITSGHCCQWPVAVILGCMATQCSGFKIIRLSTSWTRSNLSHSTSFSTPMRNIMEIDLTPKASKSVYGSDGGSYFSWSPSDLPMLKEGNIGASKIALQKNGLAMPSYSDSAKVGYVLQGTGTAGILLYEAEKEKVITVKEGDAIALPFGVVTWWFNKDDTELVVLFMGDTSKGHKAGEFTEFALTGANGIFTGFTPEFVARAWDLEEDKVKELVGSQKNNGIIKVNDGFKLPEPSEADRKGMALNCLEAPLDVDIKNGGRVVVLNTKNLPLVEQVGLGADLVRIDAGSMCSPGFSCDSAYQVTYIVRGSGRAQIVGVDGKRKLELRVKAGDLFIVPRFFVVSKIADGEGMDWFSIITTPNPIFCHLAGRTSVWKALNPQVLEASFNVSPEAEMHFRSKRLNAEIFFPAP